MTNDPKSRVNLNIRDSVAGWTAYLPPKALDSAPGISTRIRT